MVRIGRRFAMGGLWFITTAMAMGGCSTGGIPGPQGDEGPAGPSASLHGAITGVVTGAHGDVLEGAVVVSSPLGMEATTDDAGAYLIEALDVGMYNLVISASGYSAAMIEGVPVASDAVTQIDAQLQVDSGDAVLTVTVSTSAGLAVQGASVTVSGGSSVDSDTDGVAAFTDLTSGSYSVSVVPPETASLFGREFDLVEVGAGVNTALDAVLSGRPGEDAFYLGSAVCAACHPGQAIIHGNSSHGGGYSSVPSSSLLEAFDDGTALWLDVPGGNQVVANLTRDQGEAVLELQPTGQYQPTVFPVAAVVGREGGVRVLLTELGAGRYVLPVAWQDQGYGISGYPGATEGPIAYRTEDWFDADGQFLSDAVTGYVDPRRSWEQNCIGCHETGLALGQQDNGEVVSWWPTDPSERSAEAGIGCEKCHGPGSDHTAAPMDVRADWIVAPASLSSSTVNDLCAQCHSARIATVSGFDHDLPFPYADAGAYPIGGDLDSFGTSAPSVWDNGLARGYAQEADSLATSVHGENGTYVLTCLDCHDPHGSTAADDGTLIAAQLQVDPRDNGLCLGCHETTDFPGEDDVQDHTEHAIYAPAEEYAEGRCSGCHMVEAASFLTWDTVTGGGGLADHSFRPGSPQGTVDEFDNQGASTLDAGEFPVNSCIVCHEYGRWLKEEHHGGASFIAPGGDPALKSTHENLQSYFEFMYQ